MMGSKAGCGPDLGMGWGKIGADARPVWDKARGIELGIASAGEYTYHAQW